jgi:hypothetical protein
MFKSMKEFTLDRDPTCVSYVGKPSLFTVIFKYMQGLILERNHIYVSIVVKPSQSSYLQRHTRSHTGKKPFLCKLAKSSPNPVTFKILRKNAHWRETLCLSAMWESLHFVHFPSKAQSSSHRRKTLCM